MDNAHISLAKDRLLKASQRIDEAEYNFNGCFYETAVNRAYYAIFAAMRSVFALQGKAYASHKELFINFRKDYIKTGIFNVQLSDDINFTFAEREDADYEDTKVVSRETAQDCIDAAKRFYSDIKQYVEKEISCLQS